MKIFNDIEFCQAKWLLILKSSEEDHVFTCETGWMQISATVTQNTENPLIQKESKSHLPCLADAYTRLVSLNLQQQ